MLERLLQEHLQHLQRYRGSSGEVGKLVYIFCQAVLPTESADLERCQASCPANAIRLMGAFQKSITKSGGAALKLNALNLQEQQYLSFEL